LGVRVLCIPYLGYILELYEAQYGAWVLELRNGSISPVAIQERETGKGIFFILLRLDQEPMGGDARGGSDTEHAVRRVVSTPVHSFRSCGGVLQWDGHENNGVGYGTNSKEHF
jgi:hypothetical protein